MGRPSRRSSPASASWASSRAARATMQANRGRDTGPELLVRRLAHRTGLRYLVDRRPVRTINTRADMVFRGPKVAVFIDGCFWHGCPDHHTQPKTNTGYWSEKVTMNRERDHRMTGALQAEGWTVLRFWEHEDPVRVVARISAAVRPAGPPSLPWPPDPAT